MKQKMTNGFYDLSHFSKKELIEFYQDAVGYSYDTHLEIHKPKGQQGSGRVRDASISINEYLNTYIDKKSHNVCIDRSQYCPIGEKIGEIGSSTYQDPSRFLYIHTTLENLNKLVEKYNLKLKDWS